MKKIITIIYCDRCGKEMNKVPVKYRTTNPDTYIRVLRDEWENAELCEECLESFKSWWENLPRSRQEERIMYLTR